MAENISGIYEDKIQENEEPSNATLVSVALSDEEYFYSNPG